MSSDRLAIVLHGRESDALELIPQAKAFADNVRGRMQTAGFGSMSDRLHIPGRGDVIVSLTELTETVHVVPIPTIAQEEEEKQEPLEGEWITILGETCPVGGFGAFAGVNGLYVPEYQVGVVVVPFNHDATDEIDAMSVRWFVNGDVNGGSWFKGDYMYTWLRDVINYTRYDNMSWVGLDEYTDGEIVASYSISNVHLTPVSIFDTTRIASMLSLQFPWGSGATGYTDYFHTTVAATINETEVPDTFDLRYATESGPFCPIQSACFFLRENGAFDYSLPGGDYQDASVTRLYGTGTLSSSQYEPILSCKRMFSSFTPPWSSDYAPSSAPITDPSVYRRYGLLADAEFAADIEVPIHEMDPTYCDPRQVWAHTYTCNGRMIAGLFGVVTDMGVSETITGDPTVYMHATSTSIDVEVRQILDDGTLETKTFDIYMGEFLDNDDDGRACEEIGSADSTQHYYVPRNREIVLAPLNTVLVVEDRAYSTQYFPEDADEMRGLWVKHGWSKIDEIWRTLIVPEDEISGHAVRWAQDGSAFISRRWSKEKLCFEYTQASIYNQTDILTYNLVTMVESYDGWTLTNALTIKNLSYPSITQPITSGRLSIYHSKNFKIVAIMGSQDTDGIWIRDEVGAYSRLDDPDTELPFVITGREPVYISDDERCIATKTSIWIDGVLVDRPTHCCGVFFDRTHYVDRISDTQFAVVAVGGGVVATTPDGLYNFWEISDDSSVAIFSKYWIEEEDDKSTSVALIIDFADASYEFERTDQIVLYQFIASEMNGEYGKFYGYYTADNLDGIPFGRRTAELYVVGDESFYTYCEPSWGVCGNDSIEYVSHHERHVFPVWNESVSAYVKGPVAGEYARIRALYATVSVCYPDADFRRQSGDYDATRIIKHAYHHKIGILERTKDNIGPFSEA